MSPYFEKDSFEVLIKPTIYSISNMFSSSFVHDDQSFRNSEALESQRSSICEHVLNEVP